MLKIISFNTLNYISVFSRNTNTMQLCNRIYYSKVYWRLNMFRAAHRSSSGTLNCICSLWFICPCGDRPLSRLSGSDPFPTHPWQRPVTTWVCKPEAAKHSLELLMMSSVPLGTCWAFNKLWNNKLYYKAASCWLFLLNHPRFTDPWISNLLLFR